MPTRWIFSIRARLFFALALTVCISVAVLTLREAESYTSLLTQSTQANLLGEVRDARRSLESAADVNFRRLGRLAHSVAGAENAATRDLLLDEYLTTTRDGVAVFVFRRAGKALTLVASKGTSETRQARFGKERAEDVFERIRRNARRVAAGSRLKAGRARLVDLTAQTKLPLLGFVRSVPSGKPGEELLVLAATWNDHFLSGLPQGELTASRLVDRRGKIVASPGRQGHRSWQVDPAPSGLFNPLKPIYTEMFRNRSGEPVVVATGVAPMLDLAIVVQRNMGSAFAAVSEAQQRKIAAGIFLVQLALLAAWLLSQGITRNLEKLTRHTIAVASGDLTRQMPLKGRDETAVLTKAFNHMTLKIRELLVQTAEKAAMDAELVTADSVQRTLFPKTHEANGALAVRGYYRPAAKCGGDLWGRFQVADGVEFVYIADVMGHGVSSALVTAIAYSTVKTFAELFQNGEVPMPSPARLLSHLNRILFESVESKITMTAFVAVFDTHAQTITYANAGHNFPMRFRPGSQKRPIAAIRPGGMLLGYDGHSVYTDRVDSFLPGDKIVMFTDGLVEGTGPNGKAWGQNALKKAILEASSEPAEVIRNRILELAYGHFADVPAADDITLVVAEYQEAAAVTAPAPAMASSM